MPDNHKALVERADIVERLCSVAAIVPSAEACATMRDAADEIEKLRAALKAVNDLTETDLGHYGSPDAEAAFAKVSEALAINEGIET